VLPRAPQIETLIEFAHRLSSGLALLLIIGLLIWAWRAYPKGHPVRLGASLAVVFIFTEALLGAGLVLFKWVAEDASTGRIISMAVHLANTFLLLAALALTAWWAAGGESLNFKGHGIALWLFILALMGVLLIGVSGAVTALGDTLFPSVSLAEGMQQDFSPTAHLLVRLRVWHPVIAAIIGVYLAFLSGLIAMFRVTPVIRRFAGTLVALLLLQLVAGLTNLLLLAPVWMQIVHLFLADMVWIILVLLAAANFARSEISQNG
jgi:heme A synthase